MSKNVSKVPLQLARIPFYGTTTTNTTSTLSITLIQYLQRVPVSATHRPQIKYFK